MKRFLKSIFAIATIIAAASCTMENPAEGGWDTVDPKLGNIEGCELSAAGADIVTSYESASFGNNAIVNYALLVDKAGNAMKTAAQVKAVAEKGTITVSQNNLNNAILTLGAEVGSEVNVDLQLVGYLGTSIGEAALYSNIVSATFTTCAAEINDIESYPHIYTIGNFNGWAFDTIDGEGTNQYLYDYNGNGVYTGTVYFDGKAHTGWKLTGALKWDDSCNWGFSEATAAEYGPGSEPTSVTLESSGGSKDMKAWAKNFYLLSFDRNSLELKVQTINSWDGKDYNIGFDYMIMTGSFCGWAENPENGAVKMGYNKITHKFFADITTTDANAEIKFFAPAGYDNLWRLQWGDNGGNYILAEPGSYRIFLDLNKNEIEARADKFRIAQDGDINETADPTVLVPEPTMFSIVGTLNNWTVTDETYNMTRIENTKEWVCYGVHLDAAAEFKIVADHDWAESYGDDNSANGNIIVAEAGVYDIYFNYETKATTLTPCNGGWSVIGEVEGYSWSKDFAMTEESEGVWTSQPIAIQGQFKIRYNHNWDLSAGANGYNDPEGQVYFVTLGEPVPATTQGGTNLKVTEAGTYKVTYDTNANTITVSTAFPANVYMIGNDFGGWDWGGATLVELIPVNSHPGIFWCVKYMTTETEFKFNTAKAWNGAEFCTLANNSGFTTLGNNKVEKDGLYVVLVDFVHSAVAVESATLYGIGNCFDSSWTSDDERFKFTTEGSKASVTTVNAGELRMYAKMPAVSGLGAGDWWKSEFIFFADGKINYRGNGPDQERFNVDAGKTITLDFSNDTAEVK